MCRLVVQARQSQQRASAVQTSQTNVEMLSQLGQSEAVAKADSLVVRAQQSRDGGQMKQACRLSYEAAKRYLRAGPQHIQAATAAAAQAFVGGSDETPSPAAVFANLPDLWTQNGNVPNKQLRSSCGIHWACWILLGRSLLRGHGPEQVEVGGVAQACFSQALGMVLPWQEVLDAAQILAAAAPPTLASFQACECSCGQIAREAVEALSGSALPLPFADVDVRRLLFVVSY
eukprot:COSAG01_NODE_10963_length_2038_cov_15.659336_1_plen_230_part_10